MLITRYGAGKAEAMLPGHIQAVKESQANRIARRVAVGGLAGIGTPDGGRGEMGNHPLTDPSHQSKPPIAGKLIGGIHLFSCLFGGATWSTPDRVALL